MRPQQKSFVLEIKSKGRLSTVRQGSIWGTTDLKALARQAASVAPQLFETTADFAAPVPMTTPLSQDIAALAPISVEDADQPNTAEEVEPVSVGAVSGETATAQEVSLCAPTYAEYVTKSDEALRVKKSSRVELSASKPEVLERLNDTYYAADHDLALLEAENSSLKALWAKRLREENQQLRAKLERFL